jgi:hypothetical protein
MTPKIPESLKLEHEELHADLVRATKAGGKTAQAAKAVAKVLHMGLRLASCRRAF